jgi:hypothetical protein
MEHGAWSAPSGGRGMGAGGPRGAWRLGVARPRLRRARLRRARLRRARLHRARLHRALQRGSKPAGTAQCRHGGPRGATGGHGGPRGATGGHLEVHVEPPEPGAPPPLPARQAPLQHGPRPVHRPPAHLKAHHRRHRGRGRARVGGVGGGFGGVVPGVVPGFAQVACGAEGGLDPAEGPPEHTAAPGPQGQVVVMEAGATVTAQESSERSGASRHNAHTSLPCRTS